MGKSAVAKIEVVLFDVFGTVVDWRGSLIADLTAWGNIRGHSADWVGLVDDWHAAYVVAIDEVRRNPERGFVLLDVLHRKTLERLAPRYGLDNLSESELAHIAGVWHRLHGWPDSVEGLTRIKARHIIGTLSNGNVGLLVNMAKYAGLPWDVVFSAETFGRYKPDPECYLGAARILGRRPDQVMLVAAHNYDLAAAKALGLATAFIPRPTEYGPGQTTNLKPDGDWDIVARDLTDLAEQLGCGDAGSSTD